MTRNFETETSAVNLLCEGTSITGDIESSCDIRVDGFLNGKMNVNGKVVIGDSGAVDGDIVCKTIDVLGVVDGNVNAAEMVTLKSTAKINGNINTVKIAVEPGAQFTGACRTGEVATVAAPVNNDEIEDES